MSSPPTPAQGESRGAAASRDEGPWTVLRLIRWSADYLAEKGVENARLDAEHLLAHALETTRLQLYLEYDRPLEPRELDAFRPLVRRRARREPLQYILGRVGFRELELRADPRALIPRPETEELVQHVLDWARGRDDLAAVDVGTGTGCIALSLLHEGPFREVWAVDVSPEALDLARENAESVGIPPASPPSREGLHLVLGDGLAALPADLRLDVVVSNPPYVAEPDASSLAPEVRDHEPGRALFGGEDGLDVLEPLVRAAPGRLREGGLLALEVGFDQGARVAGRIEAVGGFREVRVHRDLSGRFRFVTALRS